MNEDIYAAAARWHQAQSADGMDWEGFAAWLEADERHRHAYDEIALLDEWIDRVAPALANARDPRSDGHRRGGWMRSAIAMVAVASVFAIIGITAVTHRDTPASSRVLYAATHQSRTVALPGDTRVTLFAGSRMTVDDGGAWLDGRAYFNVRHDPRHPLIVRTAGYLIRDVGTRFEIISDGRMIAVAVAEGAVSVSRPGMADSVQVTAGRSLIATSPIAPLRLTTVRTEEVGRSPSSGLTYNDLPIALVAADLARSAQVSITIAPDVAERRFSGTIRQGDAKSMIDALTQTAGLKARKEGNAIRLVDAGDH